MAKKPTHRKKRIEHKERQCPRCSTACPSVKLVTSTGKALKANWCPKCQEVFTQLGVRVSAPKSVFKGMQMGGKAIK